MSWATIADPVGVGVVPLDDLVDHDLHNPHCVCAPRVELVNGCSQVVAKPIPGTEYSRTGLVQYVRTMTVHEAMDGRE